MRLAFFIFITLLVAGAIFGVISFFVDLLRQIFEGAGYYGFITVVGILVLIVSIVSIAKGLAMSQFLEDMLCGLLGYGMGKRNF